MRKKNKDHPEINPPEISFFTFAFWFSTVLFFSSFGPSPYVWAAEETPVTVTARITPSEISEGTESILSLRVNVQPGFHAYKDMIKLKWTSPEPAEILNTTAEPVHAFLDPFTQKTRETIEGSAQINSQIRFGHPSAGAHQGTLDFIYQVCSAKRCLLPKTLHLDVSYFIVPNEISSGTAVDVNVKDRKLDRTNGIKGAVLQNSEDALQNALARGKFWAFVFVFFGGILTSLTPCVFPMIPITVSIIGARSSQSKKSRSFALSVAYVLGIAFTYSTLGVIAAMSGAVFGNALSNIYVACAISLIFFVMGLSMLGLFEIQVPAKIRNRFGKATTGSGLKGAFFTGLFAGIVASPCIGPVLVSILTFVAKTAEVFFGFALLFTFALGMGLLFIILGTFTGLIAKIPKSGPWMNATKYIFGFLLIGMSFYYIYPVFKSAGGPTKTLSKGSLDTGKELVWETYSEEAIARAKKEHKPVMIDFAADWCVACHELDRYTYTDSQVIKEAKRFTLLKLDATHPDGPAEASLKKYSIVGLPTVIFINPDGVVLSKISVLGFVKGPEFLKSMQKVTTEP